MASKRRTYEAAYSNGRLWSFCDQQRHSASEQSASGEDVRETARQRSARIRTLDCSDGFRLLNFQESSYKTSKGKNSPAMT